MSFVDSLRSILWGKKVNVEMPLDANSLKESHVVKGLAYENAELKGKVAKLESTIAKQREEKKDIEDEENVKAFLDEQKKEIRYKSQGKVFSLKSFFAKYFRDTKFRQNLAYYSFDRNEKLHHFGDIVITTKGQFGLIDSDGQLIMPPMESLKDIFQSTGALGNDIMKGMIPLNLDADGGYVENIMVYEAPELIPTENGQLQFAKAKKSPVYQILQNQGNQISDLMGEVAEKEEIITKLQNKIDKLEAEKRIHETMSETSRAELSDKEERITGIDKVFRQTQRDMIRLQNLNIIAEDENKRLGVMFEEIRKEAEREGVKLSDDKAREIFERARSTIVNEMPDVVQAPAPVQEKKEEVPQPVKQGPIIRRR